MSEKQPNERNSATPGQMAALTTILQERIGINPVDLDPLCHAKYKKPYYALSWYDANDLIRFLDKFGTSQQQARNGISDAVRLIREEWMQGERD